MIRDESEFRARLSFSEVKRLTNFQDPVIINDYLGIGSLGRELVSASNSNEEGLKGTVDSLESHVDSESAHGAVGNLIGAENYCTEQVGGVVIRMPSLTPLVASTAVVQSAEIINAPATYDQMYVDAQSNLINDLRSSHNQLQIDLNRAITKLNELIAASKTARQMSE